MTGTGILAGSFGAFTIGLTSAILLPFCSSLLETVQDRVLWVVAMTVWGTLGSILDSVLGGLLQASVVDKRTGKIVEGTGGQKVEIVPFPPTYGYHANESLQVLIHPFSTKPGNAKDILPPSGGTTGAQLRNTEAAANTAAFKGTRATRTSAGTDAGEEAHHESRRVESGADILDNNAVNVLMALTMSVGAMGVASYIWGLTISEIFA